MDFDANQVTVPEAMDRAQQLNAEIEGRQQEIDELQRGVQQRQGDIETHKMHIASCEAALVPLRKVLDTQPSQTIPQMGEDAPLKRRY